MHIADFETIEGRLAAYRIVRDAFRKLFGRQAAHGAPAVA